MTREEFKAIRKRLGFTQSELAALLGYHSGVRISEFERTKNPISVPRLLALVMQALDSGWRPKG
ncbi:transcriptional regulator with XRE-family HTH domain [Pararhizobium capsulatum DSM 1112]|uniref:Transcriptional regulator with XRE-family HTH domain n=1 Tax=Pararhizobium capsulatum DSM 1112 TaxID=1121113 RepID=A0ABU0C0Q3_9HYPH|nr:transcriptional regulator with XRE-family HTH domain [Pararhizobium capsulatum DSM 1112]